jgi:hypothetical protein
MGRVRAHRQQIRIGMMDLVTEVKEFCCRLQAFQDRVSMRCADTVYTSQVRCSSPW